MPCRSRGAGSAWLLAAVLLSALLGVPQHQAHAFAGGLPGAGSTELPCGGTEACVQMSGCQAGTHALDALAAGHTRPQCPAFAFLPAPPVTPAARVAALLDPVPGLAARPPEPRYLTTSRLRL